VEDEGEGEAVEGVGVKKGKEEGKEGPQSSNST